MMQTSFVVVSLAVLLSTLSSAVIAGDYPVVGVVLLQSAPRFEAFGTVTINQQVEGGPIVVEGIIFNLKPNSRFGLHVHEKGDITNACQSTGAHFNPFGEQHGSERSVPRHWGDFGNVLSDGLGNARVFINVPEGSMIGVDGYLGRGLVLHAGEDDLGLTDNENSKTTGNSGDRIACGVIGIRRPTERLPSPSQTQWNTNNPRPMSFVPTFRQQPQALRTGQKN